MTATPNDRAIPAGAPRARLIVPMAGVGLLLACAGVLMRSAPTAHTVSDVVRTIHDTALASNEPDAPPEAGLIGPWKISAARVDPMTGHLVDFHLSSGPMLVSARTARVVVDPVADTFTFELSDVVYTRLADPESDGDDARTFVHAMDHHTLGPAPYGHDIVADGAGSVAPAPAGDAPSPWVRARELGGE
jgi:hypothetical protein